MLLKLKIGFTILAVYEIIAVILLHLPKTCLGLFMPGFCNDGVLKYFIWCVAVPLIVFLVSMWLREIVMSARRRSFKYRARAVAMNVASTLKNSVVDSVDPAVIEKYITAAILAGAKKYSDNHPKSKETLDTIINTVAGAARVYQAASEQDPAYRSPSPRSSAPKATSAKRAATKSRSVKKKK